jgi:hypothetical protein
MDKAKFVKFHKFLYPLIMVENHCGQIGLNNKHGLYELTSASFGKNLNCTLHTHTSTKF